MADSDDSGAIPIFFPEKSLAKYGMKISDDIGHSVPMHTFNTKQIQDELTSLGFMCDFHSVRERVFNWTLPTILVIKDEQGLYGENYFWAASEALIQRYQPSGTEGCLAGEPQEANEERELRLQKEEEARLAEIKLLTYVEPDWNPRPWNSLGSEIEIDHQFVEGRSSRPPISFQFLRARKHFGRKCQFDNVDVKDSQLISCNRQIDKTYDLRKVCLDGEFQSATKSSDADVQTSNYLLLDESTNYDAAVMSDTDQAQILEGQNLQRIVRQASPMIQKAIEQNLTVNIFKDDLDISDPQEMSLGTKSEQVKFFNTFVDLIHSKNRRITAIDWDHFRPGSVAVSCAQSRTSDERIDTSGNSQPSSVLVWNFNDLIHPEIVLEAPDEVFTFRSNPKAPHIVVGGLANGQLILWNTNNRRLVAKPNSMQQRDQDMDGVEHSAVSSIAHVDPAMLSYTEKSHSRPVQDLQWLASGMELTKRGDLLTCSEPHNIQFASLAGDGYLLFWDIRGDLGNQDQFGESNESDFRWTPVYSVQVHGFNATRMHLWNDAPKCSVIYANENGQIALGTWLPRKESTNSDELLTESTANNVIVATCQAHSLAINRIQVSNDFPDLVLTVGDWSFAIFRIVDKKKLQKIFVSSCADNYLTDVIFCPTRPGVVVASKANGSLDVWDLCDQSHRPMTHDMMVSSTAISCIQFRPTKYPNLGSQAVIPYLAVGDCGGNVHIIQLPVNFTTPIPNEIEIMQEFYERERRRYEYQIQKKK